MSRRVTVSIAPHPLPLMKEAPMKLATPKLSKQERIDCAAFLVIVATLLLYVGSMFLTPQPAIAQQPAVATVSADSQEVATDSESEASGIRGLTVGELLQDAWAAQATLPEPQPLPAPMTTVPEYIASYDGEVPTYPGGYYSVPSLSHPGVTHVFQSTVAQKA